MSLSEARYKAAVSVGFGLVAFFLNFHAIHFVQFPLFKVSILPGLVFPLLVSLAWGWRYGLVSALAGGCQSMWWIWSSDGYGVLYAVPVFTAWVVWHGAWADHRRRQERVRWFHSMYVAEIAFRLISETGFYTVFRWLVSLNPPPWNPDIAWDHVAWSWVHFVVIKHLITAYVLLLIAHVLLRLGPVRRFFRLPPMPSQSSTTHVISVSLLAGCLLWLLDGIAVHVTGAPKGRSFLTTLFQEASGRDLFVRTAFLIVSMSAGLAVSRLLAQRREKERALEDSRRLLHFAVEQMPIPVIIAGAPDAEIRWINSEAKDLLARPVEGPLADAPEDHRGFWPVFHLDGRPCAPDDLPLIRAVKRGDTTTHAEIIVKRGRERRWVSANAAPLRNEQGDIVAGIMVFPDITEKKRAEATIHALNEELEQAVRERTRNWEEALEEMDDFAYSVSHDLRAPLRSISGFAQIIQRRHIEALGEEGRHYLENIVTASRRMGERIDDLLAFSRLGRRGVRLASLPLESLVREAIEDLKEDIARTGATIAVPDALPVIRGDRSLVLQVLGSLMDNALRYTPPDAGPNITISAEERDGEVFLSITDRGIGIAPEHHDKVFKVFQRLHHQSEYPGRGMGLASAKKAVSMMGGDLRLASVPGEGTTFTVRFEAGTLQQEAAS